uniref:Uncharacterized protein n=1 Tax=Cacopsylla melanoneura TaxID=428564 RepID=A0A8D8WBJ3_9HEMI
MKSSMNLSKVATLPLHRHRLQSLFSPIFYSCSPTCFFCSPTCFHLKSILKNLGIDPFLLHSPVSYCFTYLWIISINFISKVRYLYTLYNLCCRRRFGNVIICT